MGFWESKLKQCAHELGVIINQSKSGEYVAASCSCVFGHSMKAAATCCFPDCPQPVLASKLKYQFRYFSLPHLNLLSFVLEFIITFLPSLPYIISLSETLPHAPRCSSNSWPLLFTAGGREGGGRHPGTSGTEGGHGLRWCLEIF